MTAGARLPGNPSNALPPQCPMPHAQCPMPDDGRCFKPGDPSNALPPPCPLPIAQFPHVPQK
ncbi:hypothetical protein AABK37_35955, partial [Hassallia sp. VBCCA 56010]